MATCACRASMGAAHDPVLLGELKVLVDERAELFGPEQCTRLRSAGAADVHGTKQSSIGGHDPARRSQTTPANIHSRSQTQQVVPKQHESGPTALSSVAIRHSKVTPSRETRART